MCEISAKAIKKATGGKYTVTVAEKTDSTNNYIKRLKKPKDNTVVIALSQTNGRGRNGNSFFSPQGGIYLSVYKRLSGGADAAALITSCTAVATAQAIDQICVTNCGIKWVNDIFLNGKKVCGILCELVTFGDETGCIIGIGINAKKRKFCGELENIATSLENETGNVIDCNALVAEVLTRLDALLESRNDRRFLEESRRRSVILGKEVAVELPTEKFTAIALEIDDDGRLSVQTADGVRTIDYGQIHIRLL